MDTKVLIRCLFIFFQYKCSVNGCEFRNRRNRLKTHYINAHDMSEEEASKKVLYF